MCRHLGYLGEPVKISRLLFEPPHALCRQAFAPKDMRQGGTINADGFGVGWYAGRESVRYRRATPIWSDADLPVIAGSTVTTGIVAAVRSASPGMPVTETAAAPFTDGRWLFSLNGRIEDWPGSVASLAADLPVTDLLTCDAPTDAEFLWTLLRYRLRDGDPVAAVRRVVADLLNVAPASRLNLLLTDGEHAVATTWTHALSVRQTATAVTIASEPLDDDPAWEPVAEGKLVTATHNCVDITDLNPLATANPTAA